jgi:hypothetical protein
MKAAAQFNVAVSWVFEDAMMVDKCWVVDGFTSISREEAISRSWEHLRP